jgi:hypothetical protein
MILYTVALVLLCRVRVPSRIVVMDSVRIWRRVYSIVVLVVRRLVRGCFRLVVVVRVRI